MAKNDGMINLEDEVKITERDAKVEEQVNVDNNYAIIKGSVGSIVLPYPEITRYSTGIDYEDTEAVQEKKRTNKPF